MEIEKPLLSSEPTSSFSPPHIVLTYLTKPMFTYPYHSGRAKTRLMTASCNIGASSLIRLLALIITHRSIGIIGLVICLFTLTGCSFQLGISGEIADRSGTLDYPCTLYLMHKIGPVWKSQKTPTIKATAGFTNKFDLAFIIGGPSNREHWVEIECPGYERYTSEIFLAPSKVNPVKLQPIKLKKKS